MEKHSAYTVSLKSQGTNTTEYKFVLADKFFSDMESMDIRGGLVDCTLTVARHADIYHFSFDCKGYVNILCGRCLDEMRHDVDAQYDLAVKYGEEFCDDDDEVLVLGPDDTEVDVSRMLHDTVALSIPLTPHHPEGQCNEQMMQILRQHQAGDAIGDQTEMDQDTEPAQDGQEEETNHCGIDPRWEALQKLKDNKSNK